MLHQAFLNTFWACGIIAGVAVTLVTLKWSWGYLFVRKSEQPLKAEPIPDEPVAVEPIRPEEPEQKMFVGGLSKHVAQAVVPAEEAQAETVECGNCGREIKSLRDEKKSNPSLDVYECEHCGTTVAIRAV